MAHRPRILLLERFATREDCLAITSAVGEIEADFTVAYRGLGLPTRGKLEKRDEEQRNEEQIRLAL